MSKILKELYLQKRAEIELYTDTVKIIDGVVKLDRAGVDKFYEDLKDLITLGKVLNKRHGLFQMEWFD